MKKIVRKSVFETNSSSAHSISVAQEHMDFVMDTIYPNQDGVIVVRGEEFGWAWLKFNDAMTKLAYVMQDQGSVHMDMIIEVVKEQTGATEVIFDEAGGYIDHNSRGTTYEVCKDKETLRQFIFNKNSWLFTGNDNSQATPTFYDVPEFKDGRQIIPKYEYELVIENYEKTTKYKTLPTPEELKQGIDSLLDHNVLVTQDGYFISDESIFWQISRPRGIYYEKDWSLFQDYSKNEILFLKENDPRFDEIEKKFDQDKRLKWDTRTRKITEEALKVPGLIKIVKFELKKL